MYSIVHNGLSTCLLFARRLSEVTALSLILTLALGDDAARIATTAHDDDNDASRRVAARPGPVVDRPLPDGAKEAARRGAGARRLRGPGSEGGRTMGDQPVAQVQDAVSVDLLERLEIDDYKEHHSFLSQAN